MSGAIGRQISCDSCGKNFVVRRLDGSSLGSPTTTAGGRTIRLPGFTGNVQHYEAIFKVLADFQSARLGLIDMGIGEQKIVAALMQYDELWSGEYGARQPEDFSVPGQPAVFGGEPYKLAGAVLPGTFYFLPKYRLCAADFARA